MSAAAVQVGVVKKYADGDAVQELLNLVKLELGMSPDTQFLQVTRYVCFALTALLLPVATAHSSSLTEAALHAVVCQSLPAVTTCCSCEAGAQE